MYFHYAPIGIDAETTAADIKELAGQEFGPAAKEGTVTYESATGFENLDDDMRLIAHLQPRTLIGVIPDPGSII